MYRHVADAVSSHFRAATWWAWSLWVKVLCITSWNAALQLWWPWVTAWLLVWQCWHRRWLTVALRLDRIFLTLVISLHLACYSPDNKAYLMSNNNHTGTHSSHYRCQQSRQPDKCNMNNKIESKPECYLPVQKLMEQQAVTWSKTKYRSQNKE